MRRHDAEMRTFLRLLAAMAVLALPACSDVNLDPTTHREFPKESGPITRPPPGLLDGSSQ